MFPKSRAPKQTSNSRNLLSISFGVPVNEPTLDVPPHSATLDRDAPFLHLSVIRLSKYALYAPPYGFLQRLYKDTATSQERP
jgi:hypothetical protein